MKGFLVAVGGVTGLGLSDVRGVAVGAVGGVTGLVVITGLAVDVGVADFDGVMGAVTGTAVGSTAMIITGVNIPAATIRTTNTIVNLRITEVIIS
jgi:hypothetical protein